MGCGLGEVGVRWEGKGGRSEVGKQVLGGGGSGMGGENEGVERVKLQGGW